MYLSAMRGLGQYDPALIERAIAIAKANAAAKAADAAASSAADAARQSAWRLTAEKVRCVTPEQRAEADRLCACKGGETVKGFLGQATELELDPEYMTMLPGCEPPKIWIPRGDPCILKKKISCAEADKRDAAAAAGAMQSELDAQDAQLDAAQSSLTTAEEELKAARTANAEKQAELELLKVSGEASAAELASAEAALKAQHAELADAESTVALAQDKLTQAKSELKASQTELSAAQQALRQRTWIVGGLVVVGALGLLWHLSQRRK
jgi:hypothetical protein